MSSSDSVPVCRLALYEPFQPLSDYAPAQAYCSSLYPVQPITVTTDFTSTLTITVDQTVTFTVTDPTATETQIATPDATFTDFADPVTISNTVDQTISATETTFVTVTATVTTAGVQKRDAKKKCVHNPPSSTWTSSTYASDTISSSSAYPISTSLSSISTTPTSTPACAASDSLCSLFSSLTETLSAAASTICSCIETPVTSTVTTTPEATVTPEVTETLTPSTTVFVTNTETITVTPTDTAVVTNYVTTTIATETATTTTTTSVSSFCTPGPLKQSNTCSCSYDVSCDTTFTTSATIYQPATNLAACANMCDIYYNCLAFSYIYSTSSCGLYNFVPVKGTQGAASGVAAASRTQGTCSNTACEAYFPKNKRSLARGMESGGKFLY